MDLQVKEFKAYKGNHLELIDVDVTKIELAEKVIDDHSISEREITDVSIDETIIDDEEETESKAKFDW